MSALHSVKCTKAEATEFREKVLTFLLSENLPFTNIRSLRNYNGEVRIYNGKMAHRLRLRMGRKFLAFRDPDGSIHGNNKESENELRLSGGDQLWQTTNEPIETLDFTQVFRVDNWEEEKQAIRNFLNNKDALYLERNIK